MHSLQIYFALFGRTTGQFSLFSLDILDGVSLGVNATNGLFVALLPTVLVDTMEHLWRPTSWLYAMLQWRH